MEPFILFQNLQAYSSSTIDDIITNDRKHKFSPSIISNNQTDQNSIIFAVTKVVLSSNFKPKVTL